MDDRYLSPGRVSSLPPRSLSTYLSPLLERENPVTSEYLRVVLRTLRDNATTSAEIRRRAGALLTVAAGEAREVRGGADSLSLARAALVEELRREAGRDEGTWESSRGRDSEPDGAPDEEPLPIVIWVPHIRSPFNAGNILRSAAAFGIRGVVYGPDCPSLDHPRFLRAAMGGERLVEIARGGEDAARTLLGGTAPLVALETGGAPVERFSFPAAGVIALGHEELGLPERVLADAKEAGNVVTIPLRGVKRSLNVGVALGAALSWWSAAIRGAPGSTRD